MSSSQPLMNTGRVYALCRQEARPGQTDHVDQELFVHRSQVGGQDLGNGLAGSVAGVVGHLQPETGVPQARAVRGFQWWRP